eukprot:CAMPEP_0170558364 /NCGR_PEP_ID=MMETSP0211-20121228/34825_1 /TAXON_ID=311385 /ORGANISM="Pseudokeronopsis sp., Strain OXSARD2" /LENGTH=116 /DNA_ID=CAMNT_0010870225 /DNA_START=173 /DNA_END=523 /DNA_ORIENTATION=+
MMTGAHIAKEFGITKLVTNYRGTEWLNAGFFGPNILNELYLATKPKEEIREKFLTGLDYEDNRDTEDFHHVSKLYPEQFSNVRTRSDAILKKFHEKYKNSEKRVAYLIISHGISVE